MKKKSKKGLIIVHTGNGKGKTTAAIGMAFRSAGHNLKTLVIQFIKGSRHYGELEAAKRLHPHLEIIPMGKGFIRFDRDGPDPQDIRAVSEAWELFKKKMNSGEVLEILVDYPLSAERIPETMKSLGHEVLSEEKTGDSSWKILVQVK